jgi:hypothetical protein
MKGERTLIDQPFRYGGIMHDYDKDVEQFGLAETKYGKRCWCCGGRPMNCYSSSGTLLKYNYPYIAVFKITKGRDKGLNHFAYLCRRCAYNYGRGVIEMDGLVYWKYDDFNEAEYKAKLAESGKDNKT